MGQHRERTLRLVRMDVAMLTPWSSMLKLSERESMVLRRDVRDSAVLQHRTTPRHTMQRHTTVQHTVHLI